MRFTLREILHPSLAKIVVAIMVAVGAHYYLVERAIQLVATENSANIKDFWLTNFVDALPYLQTENKFLKFVTFFVGAYFLVWLVSALFGALDKAQVGLVKRLRKHG